MQSKRPDVEDAEAEYIQRMYTMTLIPKEKK